MFCLSDQVKRERVWKQRKRECEKLFWLVLLSSGPHEKLYGPVFASFICNQHHNSQEPLSCGRNTMARCRRNVCLKWCGVHDRREFNKESYWQWTPPVLDETMSPLLFISLYTSHLINSCSPCLKNASKGKGKNQSFPGNELIKHRAMKKYGGVKVEHFHS